MRRKWYEISMTIKLDIQAYPNTIQKEHNKYCKLINDMITVLLGCKANYVKDCKTGRFRKL